MTRCLGADETHPFLVLLTSEGQVQRGDLRLLLNASSGAGGGSQPMPDGRMPEPGGWNRIQLRVDDLAREVEALEAAGVSFRNAIVNGRGGKLVLLDDPRGNPIELFEPKRASADS